MAPMTESMTTLAREEQLDTLDPLRHLRTSSVGDIVPPQPVSIHLQTLSLSFPSPHAPCQSTAIPVTIRLAIDAAPGCGGIAWAAGEVLSSYLASKGSLAHKSVLELGSGTGLVGLAAAKLGADVIVTDQAPLLEIMAANVLLNDLSERVSVLELNWGAPLPSTLPHFDIILAADCVYFEPSFPLLVQTLVDLVDRQPADEHPQILFCYKKRRKADKRFFSMLRKQFSWEEVADDPMRDEYAREAISLLRITRKP